MAPVLLSVNEKKFLSNVYFVRFFFLVTNRVYDCDYIARGIDQG